MEIKIGYDFNNNDFRFTDEKEINEDEYNILNSIKKELSGFFDASNFKIVKNSDDYSTLQYKNIDIARIKYTDRAKWISIFISGECKKDNINNPLFSKEKNKNKVHWKSDLENNNISIYMPFLKKSCIKIDSFNQ